MVILKTKKNKLTILFLHFRNLFSFFELLLNSYKNTMNSWFKVCFLIIFSALAINKQEAQTANLSGIIVTENGEAIYGAVISVPLENSVTSTSQDGTYKLTIPANKQVIINCSFLGSVLIDTLFAMPNSKVIRDYKIIEKANELGEVVIQGVQERENTLARINMKSITQLPNSSDNFETILKTFSGVVSGNELSSQYSVRGGNFDENLVYVNDIEIHRPMLVQSAQQEGLSFINPSMVSTVQFSAGGFEAEYGDKMSSVLDISYKKRIGFEADASASLLGANVHVAGLSKNKKLSFNTGLRYKTSQYILNSLDVEGDYNPRFADFQAFLTYDINDKNSISILGNISTNRFTMIPTMRSTDFGTIAQTLNFQVFYEGQERDRFDSYLGAVAYTYKPVQDLSLKLIASAYTTDEEISYDILSEYYMYAVSNGSGNDTAINIGTGASLEHSRKYLNAQIYSLEHKGIYKYNYSTLKWGLKGQYEQIDDIFREWTVLDSTGFFVPNNDDVIMMDYFVDGKNFITSLRYQSFIQNSNKIYTKTAELGFTYGLRANYWNYSNEMLISPRLTITVKPYWQKDIEFYFSTGLYGQPPFYKELKDYTGKLYPDTKAQKSYHILAGSDIHYKAWNRPFTFSTELYYKNLYALIPYKIDNVQIQYLPFYNARGYAAGADFRIYGEFVPGTESWFSLSLMQTKENTYNDYYKNSDGTVVYPDYYRRCTDQAITFSIFFQDYLPSNPDYKVFLLLNYGSGLPYSGPTPDRPSEVYSLNQYRRVDVGFSRIIRRNKSSSIGLKDIWISLEVLNLLDVKNMVSYDWVHTVDNNEGYGNQFAVPNYLTGRRINIKVSLKL